jgi:hypothetical protein
MLTTLCTRGSESGNATGTSTAAVTSTLWVSRPMSVLVVR